VFTTTLCAFAQVSFAQEPPVHSFQQLRVNTGQQLIVKTEDGKTVRGSVVSLVGSQLEIERRRWSFKKEHRAFSEQSVERIELHDSELDGMLIGTGVGALGAALIYKNCRDLVCLGPFVLSISLGPAIGGAIDGFNNRTIYTKASHGARVTLSPLLGRNRLGFAARIRVGQGPVRSSALD